jgi:Fe-S-cluster containining protein
MPVTGASAADALCMQCGLCCDGTFYGSVVIATEERPRLEKVGLRVLQHDGGMAMPQPCVALGGCLCSVYQARPAACSQYECTLRKRVVAEACSLDEAIAKVAKMRELLATIRDGFDCPEGTSIWERILALETPDTPEAMEIAARDYAAAIQAVGELLEVGRADFEPRFAGGGAR